MRSRNVPTIRRARSLMCLLAVGLAAITPSLAAAQEAGPDTVVLTNGGRLRGIVMVDEPSGVSVRLADGTVRQVPRADVQRVDYASSPASSPAATPKGSGPSADGPEHRSEKAGIKGLYVTGFALLGVSWLGNIPAAAGISAASGSKHPEQHAAVMAAPFVGPILEATGAVDRETKDVAPAFIAIEAFQVIALTLTVVGLAVRVDKRVPVIGAVEPSTARLPRLTVGATAGPSGARLSLVGAL